MYTAIGKRRLHTGTLSAPRRTECVSTLFRGTARHFTQGIAWQNNEGESIADNPADASSSIFKLNAASSKEVPDPTPKPARGTLPITRYALPADVPSPIYKLNHDGSKTYFNPTSFEEVPDPHPKPEKWVLSIKRYKMKKDLPSFYEQRIKRLEAMKEHAAAKEKKEKAKEMTEKERQKMKEKEERKKKYGGKWKKMTFRKVGVRSETGVGVKGVEDRRDMEKERIEMEGRKMVVRMVEMKERSQDGVKIAKGTESGVDDITVPITNYLSGGDKVIRKVKHPFEGRPMRLVRRVEAESPLDMGLGTIFYPEDALAKRQPSEVEIVTAAASTPVNSVLDDLEASLEIPSPKTYQTTLSEEQIYHGTINSLTPSTLHSQAIEPAVPFLIRTLATSSTSLSDLASFSNLPAIEKWFKPPPSPALSRAQMEDYTPFTNYLTDSSYAEIHLPYELLTPILPSKNDGRHDVMTSFLFPSRPNLRPYLPPPGSLRDVLEKCLNHLASGAAGTRDKTAWVEVATTKALRDEFLSLHEGEPMSKLQYSTLQKYGPLFQTFHAFTAPLSLLLGASCPIEDSNSISPSLPGLYIAQAQLADLPAGLKADLPVPAVLVNLYAEALKQEGNKRKSAAADIYGTSLWLGTPPTFTPLHKDPNPNLFIQLRGQKVIKLLPPKIGAEIFARVQKRIQADMAQGGVNGGAIRGDEMMQGREKWEFHEEVWGVGADKFGEEADVVVLREGDGLFLPKGWWHSVKSLGEGVNGSVNWWFR